MQSICNNTTINFTKCPEKVFSSYTCMAETTRLVCFSLKNKIITMVKDICDKLAFITNLVPKRRVQIILCFNCTLHTLYSASIDSRVPPQKCFHMSTKTSQNTMSTRQGMDFGQRPRLVWRQFTSEPTSQP